MKKKIFKTTVACILMTALAVLSLAACGDAAGQNTDSVSEAAQETAKEPAADANKDSTGDSVTESTGEGNPGTIAGTSQDTATAITGGTASETTPEVTPEPTPEVTPEPTPFPELTVYLKDMFAEHGMRVGAAIVPTNITYQKSAELLEKQFNSITLGNAMKPDAVLNKSESKKTGELVVRFSMDAINMINWAKERGMGLRGHTLIWHEQTPNWIFYEDFDETKPLVSREVMLERMDSFFSQLFAEIEERGWSDMLYAYDVANECVLENGSLRESKWKKVIGDDYLAEAFKCARKYAPAHTDLYYNDYNEQQKVAAFTKLVETLKDENGNYLLDGIGLQAHLYTNDSIPLYLQSLDSIAALGLKVQITELDLCLGSYNGYNKANDYNFKTQSKMYYELIKGILERVDAGTLKMDSITIWGITDGLSWRAGGSPLLFDNNYQPKYSFYGVMQMKEEAGIAY